MGTEKHGGGSEGSGLEDLPLLLFMILVGACAMGFMLLLALFPVVFVLGVGTVAIGLALDTGFNHFGVEVQYWVPYFIGFACSFMYIVLQD